MNTTDEFPEEDPNENSNDEDPNEVAAESEATDVLQVDATVHQAGKLEVTNVFNGDVGEVTQLGDVYGDLHIN